MNVTVFHGFRATFSGPCLRHLNAVVFGAQRSGRCVGCIGCGCSADASSWPLKHTLDTCLYSQIFSIFSLILFHFLQKTCSEFWCIRTLLELLHLGETFTEWPCCHCAVTATLCFWCLWSALKGSRGSLHGNRIEGLPRGFKVVLSCKSLQPSHASTKHTLTGLECWKIACEAAQGTCI